MANLGFVGFTGSVTPQMDDSLQAGDLRLTALTMRDATELHTLFSDPVTHTIGDGPITRLSETRDWLRRRAQRRISHGVTWYGVRDPVGTLIGSAGLFIGRTGAEPEIGFEIRKGFQGRGHGAAAAAAVVAEGHRAGFSRIWASVRPANLASRRALDKVGFHAEREEADTKGVLVYLAHEG